MLLNKFNSIQFNASRYDPRVHFLSAAIIFMSIALDGNLVKSLSNIEVGHSGATLRDWAKISFGSYKTIRTALNGERPCAIIAF